MKSTKLFKQARWLCLLLTFALLFAAFGCAVPAEEEVQAEEAVQAVQPEEAAVAVETGAWSVFIYMCGTDLETDFGAATANIYEILAAMPSDGVNIVIQTGGTQTWQNDFVDPSVLQRWVVTSDGLALIEEQPLACMGEAQTLGDFLTWGAANFPADKYMVSFWNHGGGAASGVTFDELYDGDGLTLAEISAGLGASGASYELIGFDTCLMATLETAEVAAAYGSYMVASEELEPGGGWDYTAWAQYLYDNPGTDGAALGQVICDSYYAKCEREGNAPMATLSVLDLAKIPELAESFDAMAQEMTGVTEDIDALREFVQGATRAENYGGNNDSEGYTNMVDLGDLTMNTESVLSQTADAVLTSLFDTVIYSVKGESRANANGLSVFFPLGIDEELLTTYATTAPTSANYLRFIEALTQWSAPEGTDAPEVTDAVSSDDYTVEYATHVDADGMFTLNVTGGLESVAAVVFDIYFMDYEYNEYMLLGRDNDINGDWESGVFTDNFRGVWPTIDGNYCAPTLLQEGEGYNLYSIPIMLNGERTNLRAAYIWDDTGDGGHFEVYGAWAGIDGDTGMSDKDIIKLTNGDEVTLLFDAVNWDTGETTTYELGDFTVAGSVTMEETPLFDGDYAYSYTIIDVFGREYTTDAVIMECKGGEIAVYETE